MIKKIITPETEVYICGSVPFMNKVEEYLSQFGHPLSQIHIEAYQPSLSLIKDAAKMSITEEQKRIVKSTAPILKENGKEITSIFYKQLFKSHPELLNLFNQTNQKIGTQPLALANTVYFAAENIDNLEVLMPQVLTIANKHRALTVQPEHYP
ncbi:unnamed protein product, partial [Adineta ricciae]